MPEHPCTTEDPSDPTLPVEPPTLDFACDSDTRCTEDSCCQIAQESEIGRRPTQYIIGDCIPNGQGGCQRSTSDSPSSCCGTPCIEPTTQGTVHQIIDQISPVLSYRRCVASFGKVTSARRRGCGRG